MTEETVENHELAQTVHEAATDSAPAPAVPQEDPQERNWKEVRAQLRQLKAEKEAIERRLSEQAEASKPRRSLREEYAVSDDDLLDAKTAARMTEAMIEKRLTALQEQQAAQLAELRLRAKYADIDEVVTPESIEQLKDEDPELHATIMNQPDMYTKGAAAYKLIKAMQNKKQDPYAKERARAEANLKKPAPSASLKGSGGAPQENAFVNGLDKETKARLYKEMQEAMKNFNNR